jgi:hypothetical protein
MNYKNARCVLVCMALALLVHAVVTAAIAQDAGMENNSSTPVTPEPTLVQGGILNLTMLGIIFLVIVIVALGAYFFGTRGK